MGMKGNTPDAVGMVSQGLKHFAMIEIPAFELPQSNRLIFVTAGENLLMGTKRDGQGRIGMSNNGFGTASGFQIPKFSGMIVAAAGKLSAAWMECNAPDAIGMS